jgi:Ca2+-binding RTX toxin-like protein
MDARELAAVEALLGSPFKGEAGPNPSERSAQFLKAAWGRLFEIYYCELLYQTHLLEVRWALHPGLIVDDGWDLGPLVELVGQMGDGPESDQLLGDVGRYLLYTERAGVTGLGELDVLLGDRAVVFYLGLPDGQAGAVVGTEGPDTLWTDQARTLVFAAGGDDKVTGGATADTLYGGAGNDSLNAGNGADRLVGGPGDDQLSGGSGADVYDLSGGGHDVVTDSEGASTVLVAPEEVTPQMVVLWRESDALVMGWGEAGSVRLPYWFNYQSSSTAYKLSEVRFADGTVWTAESIMTTPWVMTGTDGDDQLSGLPYSGGVYMGLGGDDKITGGNAAETLVGGPGDEQLSGGYGADVYDLTGGGHDVVNDSEGVSTVLVAPVEVTPQMVVLWRESDALVMTWGEAGSVRLPYWFNYQASSTAYKLSEVRFADGTVWTTGDVKARIGS